MTRRTIGILGGMGTAAGVYFARKLVELNSQAKEDSAHPAFILYSDPSIPDRSKAYLHGATSPAGDISHSLNKLAMLGADFGVMVCNTAHIYFNEIASTSKLPLINMISSTASVVSRMNVRKIGLLATTATTTAGIYQDSFRQQDIAVCLPTPADQVFVNATIYDPEIGIKATAGHINPIVLDMLAQVMDRMHREHGIDHFILGCTELSMIPIGSELSRWKLVDPVALLANRCLESAGILRGSAE